MEGSKSSSTTMQVSFVCQRCCQPLKLDTSFNVLDRVTIHELIGMYVRSNAGNSLNTPVKHWPQCVPLPLLSSVGHSDPQQTSWRLWGGDRAWGRCSTKLLQTTLFRDVQIYAAQDGTEWDSILVNLCSAATVTINPSLWTHKSQIREIFFFFF